MNFDRAMFAKQRCCRYSLSVIDRQGTSLAQNLLDLLKCKLMFVVNPSCGNKHLYRSGKLYNVYCALEFIELLAGGCSC